MINKICSKKFLITISIVTCLAIGFTPVSHAGLLHFDQDLSGGAWRTTTDVLVANQWFNGNFDATDGLAALSPYGNPQTQLNQNDMMWSPEGAAALEVWFGYSFNVDSKTSITNGLIAIIADDFFRLIINGQDLLTALLVDNQDVNGQPVPIILDFATLQPFFQTGKNVILVQAMDGFLDSGQGCGVFDPRQTSLGTFCKRDLANEYLYVSGAVQLSTVVPEPASIALLAFGLAGLGFYRQKRKLRSV